jgi:hypothetical protein
MRVAARLAPIELDRVLPGGGTQPAALGSFWAERPVVLVFLRHFG